MKRTKIYLCSGCGHRKVFKSFWKWLFTFSWIHIDPWYRWYKCPSCKKFCRFDLAPNNPNKIMTWKDKGTWENAYHPGHAEGWPCVPGKKILIRNKQGKEEVILFDPETLTLDTEVIDWHYSRRL